MNQVTKKDEEKILDLFYKHMYNEASIEQYFNGKYYNSQIKTVIQNSYKDYKGPTLTKCPPKIKKIK